MQHTCLKCTKTNSILFLIQLEAKKTCNVILPVHKRPPIILRTMGIRDKVH